MSKYVAARIPNAENAAIDKLVAEGKVSSKSDFIQKCISAYLLEHYAEFMKNGLPKAEATA